MATKQIDPKLCLISEYTKLDQKSDCFRIPEYQRSYSWTIENCDKLWQDIENYIDINNEDPYFFGTVIIDCSTDGKLNLIDGQQRTTSFFLLLKALHLRLGESYRAIRENVDIDFKRIRIKLEKKYDSISRILYKADDDLCIDIKTDWSVVKGIKVLENSSINELYTDDFQKIMEAESYGDAEKAVYKIPRKQKDNKYTNFFKNFKFFHEKLKDYTNDKLYSFAEAFTEKCQVIAIRSWNIEQAIAMFNSLNSTGMPLSDADIISAQMFSKVGAEGRDEFMRQWEGIIKMANELEGERVLDIDGVLQQYMYIYRAVNNQYKDGEVTLPSVRRYYMQENSQLLESPKELCDNFRKIVDIWEKIRSYSIVKLVLKFNENIKLFLISYLYRFDLQDINKGTVVPIAECLLRLFTIIEIGDWGYSSSEFKTFLFNENKKLAKVECPIDQIRVDFNNHISSKWNKEKLLDSIADYNKNILVFLNEYLYAKECSIAFDFDDKVNVEHIMPASGREKSQIREDAGVPDLYEFNMLVNQLGNKILLEEDVNKSIGNDWFKTKKGSSVNDKMGYKDSKFGLARYLSEYSSDKWTVDDIKKHSQIAYDRIIGFIING